jgi:hypothetical protein
MSSENDGNDEGRYPQPNNDSYNCKKILLSLQQDTSNVNTRLSNLEASVQSLQNHLQVNRVENHISSISGSDSSLFGYLIQFLKVLNWKTVAIALVCPFIIRLAVYVARKIKRFK